jgi:hypothetical protein
LEELSLHTAFSEADEKHAKMMQSFNMNQDRVTLTHSELLGLLYEMDIIPRVMHLNEVAIILKKMKIISSYGEILKSNEFRGEAEHGDNYNRNRDTHNNNDNDNYNDHEEEDGDGDNENEDDDSSTKTSSLGRISGKSTSSHLSPFSNIDDSGDNLRYSTVASSSTSNAFASTASVLAELMNQNGTGRSTFSSSNSNPNTSTNANANAKAKAVRFILAWEFVEIISWIGSVAFSRNHYTTYFRSKKSQLLHMLDVLDLFMQNKRYVMTTSAVKRMFKWRIQAIETKLHENDDSDDSDDDNDDDDDDADGDGKHDQDNDKNSTRRGKKFASSKSKNKPSFINENVWNQNKSKSKASSSHSQSKTSQKHKKQSKQVKEKRKQGKSSNASKSDSALEILYKRDKKAHKGSVNVLDDDDHVNQDDDDNDDDHEEDEDEDVDDQNGQDNSEDNNDDSDTESESDSDSDTKIVNKKSIKELEIDAALRQLYAYTMNSSSINNKVEHIKDEPSLDLNAFNTMCHERLIAPVLCNINEAIEIFQKRSTNRGLGLTKSCTFTQFRQILLDIGTLALSKHSCIPLSNPLDILLLMSTYCKDHIYG